MTSEKLGTLLVEQGAITPGELSLGLSVQDSLEGKERLGGILCQYDLLSDEELARALAEQSGWPVFEGEFAADDKAVQTLGIKFLRTHGVFPASGVFVLADPYDTTATDHILSLLGPAAHFAVSSQAVVTTAIDRLEDQETRQASVTASVQDAATSLLEEAVSMGATDIHIEPSEKAVEVRLRIDGVLRFHRSFPRKEHARLVNVFFNKAELSAGDFLRFHDARFDHAVGQKKIDVRLSHIPAINGSSLVLRLLDKTRAIVSLEKLGYAREHWHVIEQALRKPYGITLLTGPTGCGKTTSLYAMLGHLKSVGLKVVAVEDPVEVRLPLVTQVPVDIRKGHDFHQVTRAFLRHDPDIVLIGEIRDEKTASEAVRAAITGHRVFSTLHTNDAASAILRLRDLGVDHSYIANTLVCVVAQRLVRKLCPYCRRQEADEAGQVVFRADAHGCSRCFEGHSGRTVVAETLLIDDEIRFMIEQGLVHEIFLKVQQRPAVLGMRADVLRLIREGVIAPEEAERVVG